jgi:putative transposase
MILYSDNGGPKRGASILETLYESSIASSFSRLRTRNVNAVSIFKTCKYTPDYPYKGFFDKCEASDLVLKFSHWYNVNYKHIGSKLVTPHQRHAGFAKQVLAKIKDVYQKASDKNQE